MAVSFKPVVVRESPPRAVHATRTTRKVAICGSHSATLVDAPWDDPSWEWWGHASARAWYQRSMDRYFDLHPKACWSRTDVKRVHYPRWLAKNTVPIYMQERYEAVPASVRYPKGRILQEFGQPRAYFTNHTAWMIALALSEGVTAFGLFGVSYQTESEYVIQRGSCEYWLGRAQERGVQIILPEQCKLLADPALLYGYESHDEVTGVLRDEYRRKAWKPAQTIAPGAPGIERAIPPLEIAVQIAQEEAEEPRPDWALGPLQEKSNGKPEERSA